ncbi:MAG: hypothetical protein AB1916_12275 [Thermodesulfobacteriota bacterium]
MSDKTLSFLTEDMTHEALAEAADNFFGRRKALDDEKDLLEAKLAELLRLRQTVLDRAATLHSLLLPDNAPDFYAALGVDPGPLLAESASARPLEGKAREWVMPKSWAWTQEGEYEKLVITAYAAVQDRLDEFLHGRVFVDSKTGKKGISVCHEALAGWCARLNARIEGLNRSMPASATLGFAKGLSPHLMEQERLVDAPVEGLAQGLDRDLAVAAVDCGRVEALALPELPKAEAVREALVDWCSRHYAGNRDQLRPILDSW